MAAKETPEFLELSKGQAKRSYDNVVDCIKRYILLIREVQDFEYLRDMEQTLEELTVGKILDLHWLLQEVVSRLETAYIYHEVSGTVEAAKELERWKVATKEEVYRWADECLGLNTEKLSVILNVMGVEGERNAELANRSSFLIVELRKNVEGLDIAFTNYLDALDDSCTVGGFSDFEPTAGGAQSTDCVEPQQPSAPHHASQ